MEEDVGGAEEDEEEEEEEIEERVGEHKEGRHSDEGGKTGESLKIVPTIST